MPSQEDYLDNLLKNMLGDGESKAAEPEELPEIDLDAMLKSMGVSDADLEEIPESEYLPEMDSEEIPENAPLPDMDSEELPEIDLDAMLESMGVSDTDSEEIPESEPLPDAEPEEIPESEPLPEMDSEEVPESEPLSDMDSEELPEINLDAMLGSMDFPDAELEEIPENAPLPEMDSEELPEIDLDAMLGSMDFPDAELEEIPENAPLPDTDSEELPEMDLDAMLGSMDFPDAELEKIPESEPLPEMDSEEVPESEYLPDVDSEELPAPDLETVSAMSEDEINRLLEAGAEEAVSESNDEPVAAQAADETTDEDLFGFLNDTDDGDLQEIQQLLEKADNNEAVDDTITDLLQEADGEQPDIMQEQPEDALEEPLSPRAQKALEKKRIRQEKAEARRAAKAMAKEAKAAAKAAKKAAKAQAAAAVAVPEEMPEAGELPQADEILLPDEAAPSDEELQFHEAQPANDGFDEDLDKDLLDSIVAEADAADGGEDQGTFDAAEMSEPSGEEDLLGNLDFQGEGESSSENADEDDGLGFDMDSLFANLGGEDDLGEEGGSGDGEGFPDFVPLEDDADSVLSEMQEGRKGKKNLFARLFEFLTDEEEEDNEPLHLSDENREILNDLDNEKTAGKKKKKKAKKAAAPEPEGEQGEAEEADEKPKKEKKAKKPKKEKKEKAVAAEQNSSGKKLSLKRVMPVLLVCASLAALILVFTNASVDFTDKQTARSAYYEGDYQTCYQNLYGKELDETEQIMFGKSRSILCIRLWLREYEMFVEEGSEVEALDSLIQTVEEYPALYAYAVQWNAEAEVAAGYEEILGILSANYGLTEEQALEIAGERSDLEYTKMVVAIVEGRPFGSWNEPEPAEPSAPEEEQQSAEPEADTPLPMEDVLPEENELQDNGTVIYR